MSLLDDEDVLIGRAIKDSNMIAEIQDICKSIIENELDKYADCNLAISESDISSINQRELIGRMFGSGVNCGVKNATNCCCIYNKALIILRLVVLDSLYSTNATYSHFTFDEMAGKIWDLGHTEKNARDYFYQIACGKSDDKKLFSTKYGVRKNLDEGGKQMSLMSKYAYYTLMADKGNYPLGFPIYDRLAKASYKKLDKHIKLKKSKNIEGNIEEYVGAMDELRQFIFDNTNQLFNGYQQFDILDAYLWRMGKFSSGNLSLMMEKADYKQFIKNLGFDNKSKEDILLMFSSITKDDNYFNKAVLKKMQQIGASAFNGLSIEPYLTKLYSHWTNYF